MMNPTIAAHVHQRLAAVARGRGMVGRRDLLARGGQLKIGGVVVSQWGGHLDKFGNQQQQPSHHQNNNRLNNHSRMPVNTHELQAMNASGPGHQQGSNRGQQRMTAPRFTGVVRLGSTKLRSPAQRQIQPSQQQMFGSPMTPPSPQLPHPAMSAQQQSQQQQMSMFPAGSYIGAPITTAPSMPMPPPPAQMGAAGYGMDALQRYTVSVRGRGRGGYANVQRGGSVRTSTVQQQQQAAYYPKMANPQMGQESLAGHYLMHNEINMAGVSQGPWTGAM